MSNLISHFVLLFEYFTHISKAFELRIFSFASNNGTSLKKVGDQAGSIQLNYIYLYLYLYETIYNTYIYM